MSEANGDAPDRPDEPGVALDGDPLVAGTSIEDQATGTDAGIPEPPPLPGDPQMTLGKMGRKPVEARVSLMSASVPVDGLMDPDKEGLVVVRYLPAGYNYVPVREDGATKRYKLVQQLRPTSVRSAGQAAQDVLSELAEAFDNPAVTEAVGVIQDALREQQLAAA